MRCYGLWTHILVLSDSLTCLNNGFVFTNTHLLSSPDVNWWTVYYCDVFIRLSFWRHPFTAEHPELCIWASVVCLVCSSVVGHVVWESVPADDRTLETAFAESADISDRRSQKLLHKDSPEGQVPAGPDQSRPDHRYSSLRKGREAHNITKLSIWSYRSMFIFSLHTHTGQYILYSTSQRPDCLYQERIKVYTKLWSSKSAYYYDFWRSCDTEDWSNDAENTDAHYSNKCILKYIHIEKCYNHNITVLSVVLIK